MAVAMVRGCDMAVAMVGGWGHDCGSRAVPL